MSLTRLPLRLFKYLFLALLLAAGLLVAVALLAPARLLPVGNAWLAGFDAEIQTLEGLRLGRQQASAAVLELSLPALRLRVEGLTANYQGGEVLEGRLRSVTASRVHVEPLPGDTGSGEELTLEEILQRLRELPLSRLAIGELTVADLPLQVRDLSLASAPLQLQLTARADDFETMSLELSLRESGNALLEGSGVLFSGEQRLLGAELRADAGPETLTIELAAEAGTPALQALPQWQERAAGLSLAGEALSLEGRVSLGGALTAPSFTGLALSLSGGDSGLEASLNSEAASVAVELAGPLRVTAERDPATGALDLNISGLDAGLRVEGDGLALNGQLEASGLSAQCGAGTNCILSSEVALQVADWRLNELRGSDTGLSGRLEAEALNSGWLLRSPTLSLSLPTISYGDTSGGAELRLEEVALAFDESLALQSADSRLVAREIDTGIEGLSLNRPRIDASLSLVEQHLKAEASVTVNNRLSASLELSHRLGSDEAESRLALAPLTFSATAPLSQLFTFEGLDLELLAGSLAAAATLQWQREEAGWQPQGSAEITAQDLGGAYEQFVFAGLDTQPALLLEGAALRSEGLQPATLRSLDFGMPVGPIDWQYAFDSSERSLAIRNLITQLFGGTVEVAQFNYDLENERNLLEVIIAGVDLQALVALADYPNLRVEGEISGYVPIQIGQQGQILIADGLVSALQPGGSIRFTPSDPDSDSPGMQLVNDALSNYQFETLNAEVDYLDNGDLVMGLQLRGNNPELGEQPINLNVTITDNIPSLIRSLQAASRITERLEEHLLRRPNGN